MTTKPKRQPQIKKGDWGPGGLMTGDVRLGIS